MKLELYQSKNELNRNVLKFKNSKLVFLSIPKSGCSSIKRWYVDEIVKVNESHKIDLHDPFQSGFENLKSLGYMRLNEILMNEEISKFALFRNPLERILSSFLDKIKYSSIENFRVFGGQINTNFYKMSDEELKVSQKEISFLDFLTKVATQKDIDRNEHWRTQTLLSFEGKLPSTKFFKLDELFKLEEWLSKFFNKKVVIQKYAPHATNAKDFMQNYYSEKEKLIAEQILEEDIRKYSSL